MSLPAAITTPRLIGLLTFAITQAILLCWWIAFYPGTLSYDSLMYVWQVSTGNWTTQHSTVYNGLVWLSLQATGQLAVLTLTQTVAMAGALAYAVVGLHRLARQPHVRWLILAATAAVCLPAIGTFTVYVSKDVAFAITQVFLLGTVARMLAARPTRAGWLALLAEFVLMGLFRQNGFVVIALVALGLTITLGLRRQPGPVTTSTRALPDGDTAPPTRTGDVAQTHDGTAPPARTGEVTQAHGDPTGSRTGGGWAVRWRVLGCGTAAIMVGFVANLLVFPALGVRPVGPELLLGPAYADIAVAFADRPAAFTDADTRLLASVAPLDYWRTTANCYNADSTVTYANDRFDFAAARAHQTALVGLWLRLSVRIPGTMAATRLCRGAIAWNPFPGPGGRAVKVPITGVNTLFAFPADRMAQSPSRDAIRSAPLSDMAHSGASWLRHASGSPVVEWFAWRGATWCYVAYLSVALFAWRRRTPAYLGLAAIIAANQLNVLINNPSQLARYLTAPIILGLLLLPLAFTPRDGAASPATRPPSTGT